MGQMCPNCLLDKAHNLADNVKDFKTTQKTKSMTCHPRRTGADQTLCSASHTQQALILKKTRGKKSSPQADETHGHHRISGPSDTHLLTLATSSARACITASPKDSNYDHGCGGTLSTS
jgi:hypothetical protein